MMLSCVNGLLRGQFFCGISAFSRVVVVVAVVVASHQRLIVCRHHRYVLSLLSVCLLCLRIASDVLLKANSSTSKHYYIYSRFVNISILNLGTKQVWQ